MHTEHAGQDGFGRWHKSSFSEPNGNNCVEIAVGRAAVALRDSKNPDGPRLVFDHGRWVAFVKATTA